jgi:excisionase family DNA binding protein
VGRFLGRLRLFYISTSLITAARVAELLEVPKSWVYEQSRRGAIPTVTLGKYRRYRPAAIEAWLAELEDPGSALSARPPRSARS